VIAPTVLEPAHDRVDPALGRPIAAVLTITGVATIAFGVAAEPLLRLAEQTSM
jgi:hypothetical protein